MYNGPVVTEITDLCRSLVYSKAVKLAAAKGSFTGLHEPDFGTRARKRYA